MRSVRVACLTIVHNPSKVIAQIGRHNVPSITSADKGKTHSILACVSASGQVFPPFMIYEWFKMFAEMIPPLRPVLLVLDGHGSHITIDVIEYARSKEIHPLCLPSHTSHILQPLDVGVFKSFKSFFSKPCRQYMAKNPGRVITEDILATVVGDAFAQSHTPFAR